MDGQPNQLKAPIHLAALHGHSAAVEALIGHGASLAAPADPLAGMLLATWAPATGPRGTALRRRGEDDDAAVPLSTPLHCAAAKGHTQVALALLRAWAAQPVGVRGPDLRGLRDSQGGPADGANRVGVLHWFG